MLFDDLPSCQHSASDKSFDIGPVSQKSGKRETTLETASDATLPF